MPPRKYSKKSKSAGGIVFNPETGKLLVVSQRGVSWSLPKGHIEPGETSLSAAKREIGEETGITQLRLIAKLGSCSRPNSYYPTELKTIELFLFSTSQRKIILHDEHTPEARWVGTKELLRLLTHPEDRAFVANALRKFNSHFKNKAARLLNRRRPTVPSHGRKARTFLKRY